jgi:hypothetical protein
VENPGQKFWGKIKISRKGGSIKTKGGREEGGIFLRKFWGNS